MADKERAIAFYQRNLGLGEDLGTNRNWITQWYGMTGPWCMMTVSRSFLEAGFTPDGEHVEVPGITQTTRKGWAYCPYFQRNGGDAGWSVGSRNGQRGDVILFTWNSNPSVPDHVGLIEANNGDGTYTTLEGNYRDHLARVRRSASVVSAIIRPPWDTVVNQPPPVPDTTTAPPFPGRILRYPPLMVGQDVEMWQRRMSERGWRLTLDAMYGKQSSAVCRSFQAEKGLAVDGQVGPITWRYTWDAPVS